MSSHTTSLNREQRQLQAVRRAQADVEVVPGCQHRLRELLGARCDETRREGGAVGALDCDAKGARDPASDLDAVDRCGLRLVHQLERGAATVEDRDPRVPGRLPLLELGQAERVAVEPERLVEVVDGQDEAELHTRPSCPTSTTLRAETPVRSSPSRATTASNASVGGSSSTAPARSRARSRYAGSGSTTTTSKPASRRSGAWMPAKPSSSTRAGGSPSSSRIPGGALTIATSDSGGGAGIQADLKAFAAAGAYGASVLVALTAQNTVGVTAIHELPPAFVRAQLDAVFDDIGVDAAKTGMLFSRTAIETVAEYLESHPVPLVVDPVMVASSGAKLLEDDAVAALVQRLFPLATVVTPNLFEARALTGLDAPRRELAERLHDLGAAAAIVTGGHGAAAVDHVFDGNEHVEIPVERHQVAATHGAGCTTG